MFKGGSTNPFAKRTTESAAIEKKEVPIQMKKSSSSEIKEDYSNGFIEDVYDDDFIWFLILTLIKISKKLMILNLATKSPIINLQKKIQKI